MNQESLDRAILNRKERKRKLQQYNKVNQEFSKLSDHSIIGLSRPCYTDFLIEPTVDEYRSFLRMIRERLDAEIAGLDKEFELL